jgi:hypothetical protein
VGNIASFAAQISATACVFNQRRTALIMAQQNKSVKPSHLKNFAAVPNGILHWQAKYPAVVVNFIINKQTICSYQAKK